MFQHVRRLFEYIFPLRTKDSLHLWTPYRRGVIGHRVDGDPKMPPTSRAIEWVLKGLVWTEAAVFTVSREDARRRYHVGLQREEHIPLVSERLLETPCFAVLLGAEQSLVFATDRFGTREIPVQYINTIHWAEASPLEIPLFS